MKTAMSDKDQRILSTFRWSEIMKRSFLLLSSTHSRLGCSLYLNGMDNISEGQFSGEGEAMVDDGFSGIEISHIQSCRKKIYQRLR